MPKKPTEEKKPKKRRRRSQLVVGHKIVDGKKVPIKKYPSASSLDKLAAKKQEVRRVYGAGGPGDMNEISVEEYAKKWITAKTGEVDGNSARTYESIVNSRIVPFIGLKQVRSVAPSDIKGLMSTLTENSPYTKSLTIYCLKAIFNMAVDDQIIVQSPAMRIKRNLSTVVPRRSLTKEESDATIEYIRSHKGTAEARFLAILYFCGCRASEAFAPQWKHIDFANEKILIDQQLKPKKGNKASEITRKLKTRNSRREIPMPAPLRDLLLPERGMPKVYLFQSGNTHARHTAIYVAWEKIKRQCPILCEISPHYYRHNYATKLYHAGVPVKEAARYMGESVTVMLNTYTHIEDEEAVNHDAKVKDIFADVAI